MWEVYTLTLVDFLEVGDLISHEDKVILVDSIDFRDAFDVWEITGTDQEWEEQEIFTIPDGHMVELMLWKEEE